MRLDPLDVRIVNLLQEDARLSFREIAERLGSTTPTISARIQSLQDIGLLRGYHAAIDHRVLGGTSYVVSLAVHPSEAHAAHDAIAALPGTYAAHLLPGGRIVAHIHLRPPTLTLATLHERLAAVPGLQTYDASEVIRSHERPSTEAISADVDVPCHQCKGPIHGDPVKGRFADRTHVFCCRHCLGTFRTRFEDLQSAASAKPSA